MARNIPTGGPYRVIKVKVMRCKLWCTVYVLSDLLTFLPTVDVTLDVDTANNYLIVSRT